MIQNLVVAGLNHLLVQGSWARRHLQPFAGRRARFVMPPWQLALAVGDEGLFSAATEAEADVTVALPADGPLLALGGVDRVLARAHVTGNAEFATALSFVLRNLSWDAEEDLSRLVGDLAAHRLASGTRALVAWQQQAATHLAENVAGYLRDEAGLLAPARELDGFRADVQEFDGRVAQLARRIAALCP